MPTHTVLVTGSSTGFGRLTAETLARRGHRVLASMRDTAGHNSGHASELRELAQRDGLPLEPVDLDVLDPSSAEAAVAAAADRAGGLDVVVHNVGVGAWGIGEAFTEAQVRELFEVNVMGAVTLNRVALPRLRGSGGGLLVYVSAVVGRFAMPFMAPYSAAKHALEAYAEAVGYEVAPFGIETSIVEPVSYPTPGSQSKMLVPADRDRLASYAELDARAQAIFSGNADANASQQAPDPQDVADAVAGLVDAPVGSRPRRLPVGPNAGGLVDAVNAASEQTHEQTLGFMGLSDLLAPGAGARR